MCKLSAENWNKHVQTSTKVKRNRRDVLICLFVKITITHEIFLLLWGVSQKFLDWLHGSPAGYDAVMHC
jgi:hypothetical protein